MKNQKRENLISFLQYSVSITEVTCTVQFLQAPFYFNRCWCCKSCWQPAQRLPQENNTVHQHKLFGQKNSFAKESHKRNRQNCFPNDVEKLCSILLKMVLVTPLYENVPLVTLPLNCQCPFLYLRFDIYQYVIHVVLC